jgi:3-phosphoshikimate 1-carboxyvinyltransferase
MLSAFGIKATTDGKDIVVYGGNVTNGNAQSYNDHRIAMASAIMGAGVRGESIILGAEAVSKSYPTFFEDLNKVGANSYDL